jgi:hypothetical protein
MILVVTFALLVVISPVGASHSDTHMSPVDAKLTQYIYISHSDTHMSPVDAKLTQYIGDNAYEHDAEISAMRWQAMANYYEDNGLLNRDTFDYEAAANNSAFRWQAMADYYARQ